MKPLRRNPDSELNACARCFVCILRLELDPAHVQRFRTSPPRSDFPHACVPKTISSTRRQYASTTFVSLADSPLVTRISGPNPESVAVRKGWDRPREGAPASELQRSAESTVPEAASAPFPQPTSAADCWKAISDA